MTPIIFGFFLEGQIFTIIGLKNPLQEEHSGQVSGIISVI